MEIVVGFSRECEKLKDLFNNVWHIILLQFVTLNLDVGKHFDSK